MTAASRLAAILPCEAGERDRAAARWRGLDRKPSFRAIKIEHGGSDRMLAAKDRRPEARLRNRLHNRASGGDRSRRRRRASAMVSLGALMIGLALAPSTALRAVPLPRKAAGENERHLSLAARGSDFPDQP